MKPLKALWRAAQSQYPQQSSEATVSQSFYLIQCSEIVYGMDCHSISQTYPCSTFQTRYASKLPLHLHLPPRCKSSALLIGLPLLQHEMNFYISRSFLIFSHRRLRLYHPSWYSPPIPISPYPNGLLFLLLLFNWHVFPKAN